jgi:diguanylate cyclase (GGDEF)-like protein
VSGNGESPSRFKEVVDGCRDAFVEFDAWGHVTEWSLRCEQLLGWRREEMAGRSILDCVSERYAESVEQSMAVLRSWNAAGEFGALPRASCPLVLELELRTRAGEVRNVAGSVFVTGVGADLRVGVFVLSSAEDGHAAGGSAATDRDRLHDPLTGLPNRALFMQRVSTAIGALRQAGGSVAVVGVGLHRFKAINDALGHDTGDALLMAMASRLRLAGGEARPMLARLGGDEFVALFEEPRDHAEAEAEAYAARALVAVDESFDITGRELYVTASAGIASTTDPGTNPSTLLSDAEAAMHEGRYGDKRVRIFGEAVRRQVVERLHTELALHRALERGELMLHYQPVVDLVGCSTVGLEALLRWHHPDDGLVWPDRFIPVAEESGLIVPIGAWVLAEACGQFQQWRREGTGPPTGTVDVNLSARQIDHAELLTTVEGVLESTGLPAEKLTLEITESALMRDADAAVKLLRSLKRIGVSLAIDDFGTGYCSLSYLHRFPVDILKVDKAFVDGLRDAEGAEIVAAVVHLAHALGLVVVAEGVETEHQLAILRQMGCDHAQGYLFSRPLPTDHIAERLSTRAPWFGTPAGGATVDPVGLPPATLGGSPPMELAERR